MRNARCTFFRSGAIKRGHIILYKSALYYDYCYYLVLACYTIIICLYKIVSLQVKIRNAREPLSATADFRAKTQRSATHAQTRCLREKSLNTTTIRVIFRRNPMHF